MHALITGVKRLDVEVEQTDLALAFELNAEQLSQQQVFAFLPLRRYGLRFIIQVNRPLLSALALRSSAMVLPKQIMQYCRVDVR